MPDDHFGPGVAEHYDATEAAMFAPDVVDAAVGFLAANAMTGTALELGIGTGRIALPLSRRGVAVHGIDLSAAMLAELRVKPGAEAVGVTQGDFAGTSVDARFGLAYLVFNTITNLTSQAEQVACFRNVARHLEPGGRFVIEVFVPELRMLPPGETLRTCAIGSDHADVDEYDVAVQGLVSHHYRIIGGQLVRHSVPFRYVWPAELDLMAELAGMRLRERWEDWHRTPFTSESTRHVSVWQLA